jgi:hypothetical protein
MHRAFQKDKLKYISPTVYPLRQELLKHRSGRTSVLVRFGASLEYLIEKDRLSLIAGGPLRIPVIHR